MTPDGIFRENNSSFKRYPDRNLANLNYYSWLYEVIATFYNVHCLFSQIIGKIYIRSNFPYSIFIHFEKFVVDFEIKIKRTLNAIMLVN